MDILKDFSQLKLSIEQLISWTLAFYSPKLNVHIMEGTQFLAWVSQ